MNFVWIAANLNQLLSLPRVRSRRRRRRDLKRERNCRNRCYHNRKIAMDLLGSRRPLLAHSNSTKKKKRTTSEKGYGEMKKKRKRTQEEREEETEGRNQSNKKGLRKEKTDWRKERTPTRRQSVLEAKSVDIASSISRLSWGM